jgi:hypothetical protein
MVKMVWGYDRDGIDAILPRCLRRSHFREAAIGTIRGNVEIERGGASAIWIGRQRRGHQLEAIVQPRRDAMYRSNEAARTAAHHAKPQPSIQFPTSLSLRVNGHRFILAVSPSC